MGDKGHSEPNIFGGYTHYDEHGHKTGSSEPGIFGGYTNYDNRGHVTGHSDPGIFGGYNHYDNHGNKVGHSDPGVFGGYSHYDSKGNKTGRSDPGVFGGYSNSSSSDGCYIATCVYGSYDCPEVWTLRRYRDFSLGRTALGRAFIRVYYAISPKLVRKFGEREWFRSFWLHFLDRKIQKLKDSGVLDTPYTDHSWR